MKNGELTKKGFIELNQMEADDNQGDVDDLWVTLNFMGYNKMLEMDEVSASYHALSLHSRIENTSSIVKPPPWPSG